MGLLDGVLGQVLGGALGGGSAGTGQTDVLNAVVGMLGNDAQGGGLGALMQQFQQAGLGAHMDSWISNGENMPISADQLQSMMGSGPLAGLAQQLGGAAGGNGGLAGMLAQVLPQVINQLTPQGQVPQGGLGNVADLLGSLLGGQPR